MKRIKYIVLEIHITEIHLWPKSFKDKQSLFCIDWFFRWLCFTFKMSIKKKE